MNEDYIVAFREILQEAERKQQEALARFHRWSAGTMDPAEEEAYTSAVRECAGTLKAGARIGTKGMRQSHTFFMFCNDC